MVSLKEIHIKKDQFEQNKITLKHAIVSTFFILISAVTVRIIVALLVTSKIPKENFSQIYFRFTPIFCFSSLIVLFLSILTRPNLHLKSLGFKKANIKRSLILGLLTGVGLGFAPMIIVKDTVSVFSKVFNNLQLLFLNPITYAYSWSAIICSPFFEEAFFRGLWYKVLKERMPKFIAIIIISFVFAILHPYQNPFTYLISFFVSIFFTLLYDKTNNLYSSIVAHLLYNLLITLLILKT